MTAKKPLYLIIAGLVLLAAGALLSFTGGPPKADAALVDACRTEMKSRGDDAMIERCSETAFASAITATDAQSAATAISAANRSEIGGNAMAMFLIGLGLALAIGGFVLRQKQAGDRLP